MGKQKTKKTVKYPRTYTLACHCGASGFRVEWRVKSYNHMVGLTMCHSGFGFNTDDAVFICTSCGRESVRTQVRAVDKTDDK